MACKPTTLYGAPCTQGNEEYAATALGAATASVPPQVNMGAWELVQTVGGALALYRGGVAVWALSPAGDVWSVAHQGWWQKRDSAAHDPGRLLPSCSGA